jgi:hypothetical protein
LRCGDVADPSILGLLVVVAGPCCCLLSVVVGLAVVDGATSSMAGTDRASDGRTMSAVNTPRLTAAAATMAMTRSRFMHR